MKYALFIFSILFIDSVLAQHQPEIIAHRGASSLAPENTMAAFDLAIQMEVDYIELDVWKSSDDSLMVIHDSTVDRTTNNAETGNISDFTYVELKNMEVGSHFSSAFAGEKIPSLYEALSSARGKSKICVELKASNIEAQSVTMIQSMNLVNDVVIFSFDLNQLQSIKNLNSNLKICYLKNPIDQTTINSLNAIGGEYVGSGGAPGLSNILYAQAYGIGFWMWTLNDTDDMQYRMSQGVDGIITDNPQDLICLNTLIGNSGLVGHWDFNAGSGINLADVTGNLNNGILYNCNWTTGIEGSALNFNGSNAYVGLPSSIPLNISGDAVSITAWVNLDQLPSGMSSSYGPIYDSDQDSYILYLDKTNAELRFKVTDVGGNAERPGIPESYLSTGTWHHVAGVYNGHNAMIYLNGNLIDYHSNSNLDNLLTGQLAEIGRNNGNYFNGQIDEVRVYNRALSPKEVLKLSNQNYLLCTNSSPVVVDLDSVGFSIENDIDFCDSASINLQANSIFIPVYKFEGLLDYINLNSIAADIAYESHSFFAWIKTTNPTNDERLFSINTLTGGNVSLFGIYNGYLDLYDGAYHTGFNNVDDGQWHFVGYTWSKITQELKLWIDGVTNAVFSNVDLTSTQTDLISLGQEFDTWAASNKFSGEMMHVSIWKNTLNNTEVWDLKQNAITNTHNKYADLVGYYKNISPCDFTLVDNSSFTNDGYSYVPIKYNHDTLVGFNDPSVSHTWEDNLGNVLSNNSSLALNTNSSVQLNYTQTGNTGNTYTDSFLISIYQSPSPDLGADTSVCLGDNIIIPGGTSFSSYNWSDGSTGQYLTFNSSNYGIGTHPVYLEVMDNNNCSGSDTVNVIVDDCSYIHELEMSPISLYPNPSKDKIIVTIDDYKGPIELSVFDLRSKLLFTSKTSSLDISSLSKGTYVLLITYDTVSRSKMIIKK